MQTMKAVCEHFNITYETLKYYCNEGLVPNHKRDKHNHRVFDDKDITWIHGILCLRDCGMSIKDIKNYLHLVYEGDTTLQQRITMLEATKQSLVQDQKRIEDSLTYIDNKMQLYHGMMRGK